MPLRLRIQAKSGVAFYLSLQLPHYKRGKWENFTNLDERSLNGKTWFRGQTVPKDKLATELAHDLEHERKFRDLTNSRDHRPAKRMCTFVNRFFLHLI